VSYSENKIVVQTTDDLTEILQGLGVVLQNAMETEGVEIDLDEIVIEEGEFEDDDD
jgi:hypothetical protein